MKLPGSIGRVDQQVDEFYCLNCKHSLEGSEAFVCAHNETFDVCWECLDVYTIGMSEFECDGFEHQSAEAYKYWSKSDKL